MKKSLLLSATLAMLLGVGVAVGARQGVQRVRAWSGTECGTTWYVVGTINDGRWNVWNQCTLNDKETRYEYAFSAEANDEFKFANTFGWDEPGKIYVHAAYGDDLDWEGKGWNAYTQGHQTEGEPNFVIQEAGDYIFYYDKNITEYENGVWAFGLEKVEEPEPEPVDPTNYTVYIGDNGFALEPAEKGDHLAQYHGKVEVTKGEVVSFKADDNVLGAIADSTDSNNVFRPSRTILEDGENVDVWLKKDRVESLVTWTYWIGGRDEAHHYYLVAGNKQIALARYEEQIQYEEYYATGVALEKGQEVKLYVTELYNGEVKEGSSGVSMNEGVMTVDEDGVYDIYYAPSANNYVYFGLPVVEHTYKFKVGPASESYREYTFEEVEKGEYYDAQYKTVADVDAMDQFAVSDFYSEEEHGVGLWGDQDRFNNVYGGHWIMFGAKQVDVYLKLKDSKWYIYIGGRQSEYVLLIGNQSGPSFTALLENPQDNSEVMATNVELPKDYMGVLYYDDLDSFGTIGSKTENVVAEANVQTGPSTSVKGFTVSVGGTYNVYVKKDSHNLYIDDISDVDQETNAYAESFLDKLSTGEDAVCKADGTTTLADLQTAWGELKTAFAALSDGAKLALKDASASASDVRGQFAKLYEYIVHKYGSAVCEDFVNRFNGEVVPPNSNIGQPLDNSTPFMAPVVVIIALATVTAIGFGLYIFSKKKEK